MLLTAENLPRDIAALHELVLSLQCNFETAAQKYQQRITLLEEQLRLLRHQKFGARSEQHTDNQLGLFNEAEAPHEAPADDEAPAAVEPVVTTTPTRRRGKRAPLPTDLPRVVVIHDLPDEEKVCPYDGASLVKIGEEISEQLDIIPAQFQVVQNVRYKYACPCCEQGVTTAPLPPQPLPKSQASPGLLAYIATAKYLDALPLYRMVAIFQRLGMATMDRTTLANWMIKVGILLLPLIRLLEERLTSGSLIHMDETTVQVLNEPGRAAQSHSYMWVRYGGAVGERILLFDYDPSRSNTVPKRLLVNFQGTLLTDGYEGYGAVVRAQSLIHAGCWAHARRKFDEVIKARPKGQEKRIGKADQAIAWIGELYVIERRAQELTPEARQQLRQTEAKPLLETMKVWLDTSLLQAPPKSLLGKALGYLSNQWPKLTVYLDDGRIPMDNNAAENAIRPFAIGRKNWLFSQSVAGATSSAAIYSLLQTAKTNGLEPYAYLTRVLTELPKATTVEEVEALLPFKAKVANVAEGRLED